MITFLYFKNGLKKEDLYFLQHPTGDSSSKKVLRFFSEAWVENNIIKGTIEKTLENVSQLAVKNHFEVRYETVDISSLTNGANQVLCFFNDLDRSPTFSMYDSFHLQWNKWLYGLLVMMISGNIFWYDWTTVQLIAMPIMISCIFILIRLNKCKLN